MIEKHGKQLEDLTKLPTPQEIVKVDNSDHKKESIKILSSAACSRLPPSRRSYCHVRDYLITYIVLGKASRAGASSNMTMKEFDAQEVQPDGSYNVSVKDHKTAANAGPAMLSIEEVVMGHLRMFVHHM